jgi:hypothetical protein
VKLLGMPTRAELNRAALLSLCATLACLIWPLGALAQEVAQAQAAAGSSAINVDLGTGAGLTTRVVQLVGLMTVLSLAPSIVIMTTSFVRIVVVLSLLRTALGMQQSPPNAVLVSLALFLSAIVMAPTWQDAYDSGIRPLMDQQMELPQAFDLAAAVHPTVEHRGSADGPGPAPAGGRSGLHDQRAEDRVRDRISSFRSVSCDRSGRGERAHVHGHDDAAARGRLPALQAHLLRAGGRLETGGRQPGRELPEGVGRRVNPQPVGLSAPNTLAKRTKSGVNPSVVAQSGRQKIGNDPT